MAGGHMFYTAASMCDKVKSHLTPIPLPLRLYPRVFWIWIAGGEVHSARFVCFVVEKSLCLTDFIPQIICTEPTSDAAWTEFLQSCDTHVSALYQPPVGGLGFSGDDSEVEI